MGKADFMDMTISITKANGVEEKLQIKRIKDNIRERPNGAMRHEPLVGGDVQVDDTRNTFLY